MVQPSFSREMREDSIATRQRPLQSMCLRLGPLHLGVAWWHSLCEFSGVIFVQRLH